MALEPGGRDGGTELAGELEWAIDGRKREEMREKNASGGRVWRGKRTGRSTGT